MPHVVGSHDVLPLNALGALVAFALGIVSRLEIAAAEVYMLFVHVLAPAIECLLQVAVVNSFHLLARVAVVVVLRGGLGVDFRKSNRKARSQEQWKCR